MSGPIRKRLALWSFAIFSFAFVILTIAAEATR